MPVRWLKPSPILGIERFTEFEQFRPNDVVGGGISVPLQPKHFSSVRAILPLQDSLLVLQRSFARTLETELGVERGVGLMIPIAFHATINGRAFDNSMVALMRDKIPTYAIEQHSNTYLMLRFNSAMRERGWADFDNGLRIFSLTQLQMERLRATILDAFCLASECADFDELNRPIQETIIAELDTVFVREDVKRVRPGSYDKHRNRVEQLDEVSQFLPTSPLYSEEMASRLGVSVRTLQTAVQVVHGMSLYQYLRLKRLWSVRRQLLKGSPMLTVKAAAQANGFWHMGEFSKAYKFSFGEAPSETLARVRNFLIS